MGTAPPVAFRVSADPGELLSVAGNAARAGARAIAALGGAGEVRFKSSATDPVTEADEASEAAVRAVISEHRPQDGLVGEEGDAVKGESGLRWVIDPLDGTVNFLYGFPQWCVSVAVEDGEGPVAGVVYDPSRDEEFSATRGQRALLGGRELPARPAHEAVGGDPLEGVLLATGFNYEPPVRELQGKVMDGLTARVRDIRRGGSAALDLCWVAAGRIDAYIEHGVHSWDIAAGALACRSVGLDVRTLPAMDGWPTGLVAAPAGLCEPLAAAFGWGGELPAWPQARID